ACPFDADAVDSSGIISLSEGARPIGRETAFRSLRTGDWGLWLEHFSHVKSPKLLDRPHLQDSTRSPPGRAWRLMGRHRIRLDPRVKGARSSPLFSGESFREP